KSSAVCSPGGAGRNRANKPLPPGHQRGAGPKKTDPTVNNIRKKATKNFDQLFRDVTSWPGFAVGF
ncbi:hypothetical protein ACVGW8_03810, partial [Enterobacter hormaechei]